MGQVVIRSIRGRYTCLQEPFGKWAVWDEESDQPAVIDGEPLIGLPEFRATAIAEVLNKIDAGKRDWRPKSAIT